jgi:hypothetical protein
MSKTGSRDYERSRKAAWRDRTIYGLTPAGYDELLASQGGVCAICGRPRGKNRLAVDHDHVTGRVRGLLCIRCNRGIAPFEGRPEVFMRAAEYINRDTHFVSRLMSRSDVPGRPALLKREMSCPGVVPSQTLLPRERATVSPALSVGSYLRAMSRLVAGFHPAPENEVAR